MRSSDSGRNISLTSYDDIFSTEESREEAQRDVIEEIPLSKLVPFKNHPFKVTDDERMQEMADSIRKHGVFVPALARALGNGDFEIISGHRRKRACELAGLKTMPVIIRNLNDDEAVITMVESNLRQRENILMSERAKAVQMMMDALRHQGKRTDLTSGQIVQKLATSLEQVAEGTGEHYKQIQRLIRLNNLVKPLLEKVDSKEIAFTPAVELSYLKPEEQSMLLETMAFAQATPSLSQAQRLKKMSQEGSLSPESMKKILSEIKKPVQQDLTSPPEQNNPAGAAVTDQLASRDGFIMLPIEPFLKFLPKSLFQNPTPEGQEKMTKLFLKMAELYRKYINKKREQQR